MTNLRAIRKSQKLSLQKLSDMSDVSYKQLQGVDSGTKDIGLMSTYNFLKIAKALNVDPYELLKPSE